MAEAGKFIGSLPRIHELDIVSDGLGDTGKIMSSQPGSSFGPPDPSYRPDSNIKDNDQSMVENEVVRAVEPYVTRHDRVAKRADKLSV